VQDPRSRRSFARRGRWNLGCAQRLVSGAASGVEGPELGVAEPHPRACRQADSNCRPSKFLAGKETRRGPPSQLLAGKEILRGPPSQLLAGKQFRSPNFPIAACRQGNSKGTRFAAACRQGNSKGTRFAAACRQGNPKAGAFAAPCRQPVSAMGSPQTRVHSQPNSALEPATSSPEALFRATGLRGRPTQLTRDASASHE